MKLRFFKSFLVISSSFLVTFSSLQAETFTIGESSNPYDRGSGSVQAEHQKDLEDIESFYDDCGEQRDSSDNTCLNAYYNHFASGGSVVDVDEPEDDGLYYWLGGNDGDMEGYDCTKEEEVWAMFSHCQGYDTFYPYREYWMAFQKGEQVQVPFTTAYVSKGDIQSKISESEQLFYAAAPDLMTGDSGTTGVIDHLNSVTQSRGLGRLGEENLKETTEEAMEDLTQFDKLRARFRNAIPASGGYRYMVGHIFSTYFHETYAMDPKYNAFPSTEGYNWVHNGAKHGGRWNSNEASQLFNLGANLQTFARNDPNIKPPIPDWLSEAPVGDAFSGLAVNYFYGPSQKYFPEMTFPGNTPSNCMKMRMDRGGLGSTPTDIVSEQHKQKLDVNNQQRADLQKCLPGTHGAKFSYPMAIVDTSYATVAENVAFYRNLRAAYRIGNSILEGEFHDLQEMLEGDHKRDRIQHLGRKGEFYEGCKPFKEFNHFIPDISGLEYSKHPAGNVNSYQNRREGEYFRSVHWRYVRGCPINTNGPRGCFYPARLPGQPQQPRRTTVTWTDFNSCPDPSSTGGIPQLRPCHNHVPQSTGYNFILK